MTKGIECSYSRWMTIWGAVKYSDEYKGEKLLVLIYLGLREGWVESYEMCGARYGSRRSSWN